jgi:hypothetical protein
MGRIVGEIKTLKLSLIPRMAQLWHAASPRSVQAIFS